VSRQVEHDIIDMMMRGLFLIGTSNTLCSMMEFGARPISSITFPHQRLQLLGDRDHLNVVDHSDRADWIHDRDFNAAVAVLPNDRVAEQYRADSRVLF
jgi:hypothetical protein